MTKRMLIDATHAEETRVVVLDGSRLEDFDVETSTKRQLKGNIYLAKVVRVEPSLQAAFVEYGGNRHGFLAFSEIHPDYYQIPIADRQRLLDMEAEEARREEEEEDLELALGQAVEPVEAPRPAPRHVPIAATRPAPLVVPEPAPEAWARADLPPLVAPPAAEPPVVAAQTDTAADNWARAAFPPLLAAEAAVLAGQPRRNASRSTGHEPQSASSEPQTPEAGAWARAALPLLIAREPIRAAEPPEAEPLPAGLPAEPSSVGLTAKAVVEAHDHDTEDSEGDDDYDTIEPTPPPETVGGDTDGSEDRAERRMPPRFLRNYKIQEVIRRRQILLVQVVKEERGTKGAALTTYLSLAGRFSVLMPNSPRGGGISRKITSAADRRRLKEVTSELDLPRGMGLIIRTAGAARPKPEIKRDCEYLLRLWDDIREHTMKSVAPALIYEEASLIKRAIRDVYSRDIDEILVDGQEGWHAAHDFMRMLMPTHAKKVILWNDGQPLFARSQVEAQLDAMLMPIVQLRSGGYLVINQAEALVAIDVNSGRSTRERNIEETALRTNLEAADEVARQLRLRDLAGLIVIDFIDMESKRHNAMVERRLKEALKNDRARIQVGHISHFGLMEMSRQRLRPSLAETSFIPCQHCGGTGHVRSTENAAIHVLRGIEDEGGKRRAAEIVVHMATPVALYLLNHKRDRLREIELRYTMRVIIAADDSQIAPQYRIERVRAQIAGEASTAITPDVYRPAPLPPPVAVTEPEPEEEETATAEDEEADDEAASETDERSEEAHVEGGDSAEGGSDSEEANRRRRRRRRRRGGRREDAAAPAPGDDGQPAEQIQAGPDAVAQDESVESEPGATTEPAAAPAVEAPAEDAHIEGVPEHAEASETEEESRNRRRGRRGGRRRRRDDGEMSPFGMPGVEQPDLLPAYTGPTPANPFGGQAFDIFDVMEQVEQSAAAARTPPAAVRSEDEQDDSGDMRKAAQGELADLTPGADEPVSQEIANATAPEPHALDPNPAWPLEAAPPRGDIGDATTSMEAIVAPASGSSVAASAGDRDVKDAEQPRAAVVTQGESEPTIQSQVHEPVPEAPAEIVNNGALEPAATETVVVDVPSPEPSVPANDTAPEPLVKPIIIGSGEEPPVAKKRGWWRR
jgi:ribonuclease E